jgi:hypothetical protein
MKREWPGGNTGLAYFPTRFHQCPSTTRTGSNILFVPAPIPECSKLFSKRIGTSCRTSGGFTIQLAERSKYRSIQEIISKMDPGDDVVGLRL